MGIGQEWATPENELPYTPDLHISGTVRTPRGITFWMFNPLGGKPCRIRCGICRNPMDGHRHCPYCFPDKQEAL